MGLPLSLINLYSNLNLALKAQQNLVTAKKSTYYSITGYIYTNFYSLPSKGIEETIKNEHTLLLAK
jgi:hypothetical protein